MVLIKGVSMNELVSLPGHATLIAEKAKENDITHKTVKPISFEDVSKKIGESPAFLILSMLKDTNCSKGGIEAIIEIIHKIAGDKEVLVSELDFSPQPPFVRPFNFKLKTDGFLNEDLDNYKYISCSFIFTPEAKYDKSSMRDHERGTFSLDLEIRMSITIDIPKSESTSRVFESVDITSAVVEFDGRTHLADEDVRKDKNRDSMIQGLGKTVFRIQTPYRMGGKGSTKKFKSQLDTQIDKQIGDIKEFFRNTMYRQFKASNVINTAIQAGKEKSTVRSGLS